MSEGSRRALLTDKERAILLGEEDVSEKYYYVTVTRVRKKIKQLDRDIEALEEHDSLGNELRDVVCEE